MSSVDPDSKPAKPLGARHVAGLCGVLAVVVIALLAATLWMRPANALKPYADDTGWRCSICHSTPATDMSNLTNTGLCYQANGGKRTGPTGTCWPGM